MRSLFATLLSLVLPSGAVSGPRLVLDGVNAQILLYNLAGLLYGSITPGGGFQVFNPVSPAESVQLTIFAGVPALLLATDDVDEDTPARLLAAIDGAGGGRNLLLDIASGSFTTSNRARLVLASESQDATEPARCTIDAAELEVDPAVAQTIATNTDASGFVTFNHGAAHTPKLVVVEAQAPSSAPAVWCTTVDNIGATTARARFLAFSGGVTAVHASAAVTFRVFTVV